MKICLIRLDKIGDLVLSLPVDQIISSYYADAEIQWVTAKPLDFILKNSQPKRNWISLDLKKPNAASKELNDFLNSWQPNLIVFFYGPTWAAYEVGKFAFKYGFLGKNNTQIFGRYSQWCSWLFFSSGLRQKRSLGEKHETQYNLELLLAALNYYDKNNNLKTNSSRNFNELNPLLLKAPVLRNLFEKHQLARGQYVVVHPGMAGSALNWSKSKYVELIEKLKLKYFVVITGTEIDSNTVDPIAERFAHDNQVLNLKNLLDPSELLFILQNAKSVIAPSTGVAHLAASLGTQTIALYSPIASQNPKRWAPMGPNVKVFVAPKNENIKNLDAISVADIVNAALE